MIQAGRIEYRRPGKNNCLRFGTWNVFTVYKIDALRNIINVAEEYGIQVLAVQEVQWIGSGVLDKTEYTFYYSGHSKTRQFGTGFLVSRKIRHLVIDYVPISMRLCKIRIRGRYHNYSRLVHTRQQRIKTQVRKICFMTCWKKNMISVQNMISK